MHSYIDVDVAGTQQVKYVCNFLYKYCHVVLAGSA